MDTQNVKTNFKEISKTQKIIILSIAAIMFIFCLVLLITPTVGGNGNDDNEPDYNLLIQELQENSDEWGDLEKQQDTLEVRNAEIRTTVCATGVCVFQ